MSSETDYYIIERGAAKKLFNTWNKRRLEQTKKRMDFLKRHKCGNQFYSGGRDSSVIGLIFDKGKDPDQAVWRRVIKGYWVPRKTTPEGKALAKEMRSLADPSFTDLTQQIVGIGYIFWGLRAYYPGVDWLNKKPVLLIPNPFGDKERPKTIETKHRWERGYEIKLIDGVRELKRSEFWALKEQENKKKRIKRAG